jgi:hypothetical protein
VGSGTTWCTSYGQDCNSLWADPRLGNLNVVNFNPTPGAGSAAIDPRFPNGYAGAIGGADVTGPRAVADLTSIQVGDVLVTLSWTAPGDDGAVGTVAAYDLRRSTSLITDTNFSSATAVLPSPVPVAGGLMQTYVSTGLLPNTRYYYAIKARDDAGNWSPISNVYSVTTSAVDVISPAKVGDLGVSP